MLLAGCSSTPRGGHLLYANLSLHAGQDTVRVLSNSDLDVGPVKIGEGPHTINGLSASGGTLLVSSRDFRNPHSAFQRFTMSPPYTSWTSLNTRMPADWLSGGLLAGGGRSVVYLARPLARNDPWKVRKVELDSANVTDGSHLPPLDTRTGWFKLNSVSSDSKLAIVTALDVLHGRVVTQVYIVSLENATVTKLCAREDRCVAATFSPDSTSLALLTSRGLTAKRIEQQEDKIIKPASEFSGELYNSNTIAWCRYDTSSAIYIPLKNKASGALSLWRIMVGSSQASTLAKQEGMVLDFLSCY